MTLLHQPTKMHKKGSSFFFGALRGAACVVSCSRDGAQRRRMPQSIQPRLRWAIPLSTDGGNTPSASHSTLHAAGLRGDGQIIALYPLPLGRRAG